MKMKMGKGKETIAHEMHEGKLKSPWYLNAKDEEIAEVMGYKGKGKTLSGIHTMSGVPKGKKMKMKY